MTIGLRLALSLLLTLWAGAAAAQTQCSVPSFFPGTPVVSTAAEGSHILKAVPGCLLSVYVTAGSTAGYLLLFNSDTVPADGAVTPQDCIQVPASTTQSLNWAPQPPEWFSAGLVAVFSTTGCFTKTLSATAYFHAFVQ